MQLLGYSERGFINAFFYGVFQHPSPSEIIRAFLALAHWPLTNARPPMIVTVTLDTIMIEQSFSDFGDADVLILLSTQQGKIAVFCEAKRGSRGSSRRSGSNSRHAFRTT